VQRFCPHCYAETQIIKGIRVKDKEVLLAQSADDTILFLNSSEQSFNNAFWTLQKFVEMPGLKINNDKTRVISIGSKKKFQVQFIRDMNFCWDPGTCSVL